MSQHSSLRTRLTLMILVCTAAVSVTAVVVGMNILRGDVRDAAIDSRRLQPNVIDVVGVPEQFAELDMETGVAVAIEADAEPFEAVLDAVEVPELAEFERDVVLDRIDEFDLYVPLVERFANASGTITLLLSSGDTLIIDRDGPVVDQSTTEGRIVVDSTSIADIGGSIFTAETVESGDRELAFASNVVDGRTVGFVVDLTDGYRALDEVADALWLGAGTLTALAALGAWLLIGRALTPVAAITQRVSEISARDLNERVPVPVRRDEIGTLASTMNTMLDRLEENDLQRRQFISDASHELRTPVAVLQSEAEVARKAPHTTSVGNLSDVVLEESRRLGELVEDLLSIARSDEGGADLQQLGEVDVDDVILAESSRTRRVPIDRRAVSAGRIIGRPSDVEVAVRHLLDNASRHADSQVAIGVRTEHDEVVCWVDDDGSGIAEEDRRRVFERFARLDAARARDRGGAGLGLAVVAGVISATGGTIRISDAPMGGARFEIRWPAA